MINKPFVSTLMFSDASFGISHLPGVILLHGRLRLGPGLNSYGAHARQHALTKRPQRILIKLLYGSKQLLRSKMRIIYSSLPGTTRDPSVISRKKRKEVK